MAAPTIPNLLSLRGTTTAAGGRGRGGRARGGRGGAAQVAPGAVAPDHHDAAIQATDSDAAVSRLSAVELGYLDDPFARFFVRGGGVGAMLGPGATRRLPIINRGTYARTTALDRLVDSFLSAPSTSSDQQQPRQIVSLGAGTDTRSLRLFSGPGPRRPVVYHELDFPATCREKLRTVLAVPALRRVLPDARELGGGGGGTWGCSLPGGGGGDEYWCHGLDLRQLAKGDSAALKGLRTDLPTLLISECCLCYLQASEAAGVTKWFADRIADLAMVIYEPVKPDDPFGRMMVSNLAARRIAMPTLEMYKEPADQHRRLRDAGFEQARQMTIEEVWERWVSEDEKERVDGLEGLDEVEEWKLLAGHYIVAWGWRGGNDAWMEDT